MVLNRPVLVLSWLLAATALLASCKSSSKPAKLPKNLPKISVSSSSSSPPHRMSRGEYPFDSRGNYVTSWAAEGDRQRRSGGYAADSRADYTDWQDSHHSSPAPAPAPTPTPTAEPPKKSTFSLFGRRSSSSTPSVAATPPPQQPVPAPLTSSSSGAPVMVLSSTGSQSRVTTSTPPSRPSTTSAPKPVATVSTPPKKPAPKPSSTPASVTHTVKSGDTLYGIALRYKSTVAKIKSANSLKTDLIRPGQKLRVPR